MNLFAVVLSTCIGVGGWGWPISISVRCITVASWPFSKAAAISHSAADETIFFENFAKSIDRTIEFGFSGREVGDEVTEKEVAAYSTFGIGFDKVCSIAMYLQNYVRGYVGYRSIREGKEIIQASL